MKPRSSRQRSALTNGNRPFLTAVHGNSEIARRYKDVLDGLIAERPAMTTTEMEAARAFAGLATRLSQLHADLASGLPVDTEAMGQIGDRMARLERRMPPPKKTERKALDLKAYVASRSTVPA